MRLQGLLFFPITPFANGELDQDQLKKHIEQRLDDCGAVFVACGTGEFASLSTAEHVASVRTAVETVAGRVPVIAGAGGPLPQACHNARSAAEAGADGVLVLPPYLSAGPQEGLVRYVHDVAEAGDIPVIAYQRGIAKFTPESAVALAAHPRVVGFKDGVGDLDLLKRIVVAIRASQGSDFMFFNGLPTAELTMPAYRGIGVDLYSSAIYAFLPETALAFYNAFTNGDDELVERLLADFVIPLVELRNKVPGYAVALIKAGAEMRGLPNGGVRTPLVNPTPEHLKELARLIDVGLELAGA